jgi:hypothetical protein
MLPCVTRYVMMAPNNDDEMKLVMKTVGNALPHALCYSGGEICPIRDRDGRLHNHHHNYTFSACVF